MTLFILARWGAKKIKSLQIKKKGIIKGQEILVNYKCIANDYMIEMYWISHLGIFAVEVMCWLKFQTKKSYYI